MVETELHSKMITHTHACTHTSAWTWCILIVMCDLCSSVVCLCHSLWLLPSCSGDGRGKRQETQWKAWTQPPSPGALPCPTRAAPSLPPVPGRSHQSAELRVRCSSAHDKKTTSLSHLKRKRGLYTFYFKSVRSILFQTKKLLICNDLWSGWNHCCISGRQYDQLINC